MIVLDKFCYGEMQMQNNLIIRFCQISIYRYIRKFIDIVICISNISAIKITFMIDTIACIQQFDFEMFKFFPVAFQHGETF